MAEVKISAEQLILIGGSSGSLEAILSIFPLLKPGFVIPILLILHRNNQGDDSLALLLSAKTVFFVKEADEKEAILPGNLYIAPADYHLLIEKGRTFSLDASPKVNYSRPSIDVCFTSAATVYKENLIAILVSGANADGAAGLKTVQANGGTIIVQDPKEAIFSYMPEQAIIETLTTNVMNLENIAAFLNRL